MIIQNGFVFFKQGIFRKADVQIEAGRITRVEDRVEESAEDTVLDAAGKYVVPGFVDIHAHGAVGHDFCYTDPDGLRAMAAYERSCGVTAFCPTSMTLPTEMLEKSFRNAAELMAEQEKHGRSAPCARLLGIHMEGPFLSKSRRGAQKQEDLRLPDMELFRRLNRAAEGRIRLVTLAPELPGAQQFVKAAGMANGEFGEKLTISLGHTEADYATSLAAFEAGADHVTHLFNGMPGLHHREPGLIGAALEREDVYVEVICDGLHIHPAVIRGIFRLFGPDRVCLISDSTEAVGEPEGFYQLGGQRVYHGNGAVRLEDGTLAGSALNLFECFQKALKFGIPPETALKAVTCNPAKSIGMQDRVGCIERGAFGDLLILDHNWDLLKVI